MATEPYDVPLAFQGAAHRCAAGEPGVGKNRHTTADWPAVHSELQTQ